MSPTTTTSNPTTAGADTPIGALFGALTRLRGKRFFHPDGTAYESLLRIDPDGPSLARGTVLGREGEYAAVVRLSRGAGAPLPLPDIHGVAVKVRQAEGGAGADQDLLLVTSGTLPLLRHALVPTFGFDGHFSSIVPFRAGKDVVLVGARVVDEIGERPSEFEVVVAEPFGPWLPVGRLLLGRRLADDVAEGLRYSPWHAGGGLEPLGLLNRLRRSAYRSSQAARAVRSA